MGLGWLAWVACLGGLFSRLFVRRLRLTVFGTNNSHSTLRKAPFNVMSARMPAAEHRLWEERVRDDFKGLKVLSTF